MKLETFEKALDVLKEIDEHVLACIHILRRLTSAGYHDYLYYEIDEGNYQEKDTYTSKYHFYGRECLINDNQSTDGREIASRDLRGQHPH